MALLPLPGPNSISPGFVRLEYISAGHRHQAIVPCIPIADSGSPFGYALRSRTGVNLDLVAATSQYVGEYMKMHHTSSSMAFVELYVKSTPRSAPQLVFAGGSSLAGSAGGSPQVAQQTVLTFRTTNGGLLKVQAMETPSAANIRLRLSGSVPLAGVASFRDYLMSTACWVVGRDNGYPFAPRFVITKTNDALRRRYLL